MGLRPCDRGCASENESEETWSESASDEYVYEEKQNAFGSESVTCSLTACDAIAKDTSGTPSQYSRDDLYGTHVTVPPFLRLPVVTSATSWN